MTTLGVLMMAYGTPRNLDEVEPYYTDIRRGRKPSPAELADLIRRYEAIGGVSPLHDITERQARAVEQALNARGDATFRVYLGMKHTEPRIAEAVAGMRRDGIDRAIAVVLAPHYSAMSVETYHKQAREAALDGGPMLHCVNEWHLEPRFLDALAARVEEALRQCHRPEEAMVIFTAHSLPARILEMGDPYVDQLRESGEAVAQRLGLVHYTFGWQSAGRTQEPWLGPDLLATLESLRAEGYREVVVCAQGFVADHLEVLYDIDIEAKHRAEELGIRLVRTRQMNDDPDFVRAVADVIEGAKRDAGW
ncbi:ferrochelatase [Alicyclobacillus mali]|uniref:Coproporphyrin III ferrochelatase n=1 Tax=Alicyclobacillus mali (ex Roth et al. 2021) TaxID=1123961 RepID=A0ABS0F6A5_9BACL|nr:ferrochelatase [Alicyclobacillus mali (ex Roth et al. 2021)]MBF8378836.1 ferrochelatase [Alicyclobacillus mali (ex Roth et al. 2021)]